MTMIPRTECAYLTLRRNYYSRQSRGNRFQHTRFYNTQNLQTLNGDPSSTHNGHTNKAFLRSTERNFVQKKDPNVIPFNLQLKKLAKARNWRGALKCIEQIHQRGLCPDEISYATAIDACSKALKSKEAIKLFEEMKRVGIRPNVPIYNAVMNACARDHQWRQSLNFLRDMRSHGVVPNIVSYNVCLSALEKAKKWREAVDLMKEIRQTGISLQVITYNTVISACAKARKMNVCEEIFTVMKQDGFQPDGFTFSSLLNGYRKVRNWDAMFRLCDEMKARHVPLDAVIYSTVIGACADAGQSEKAFELFLEMKKNGIKPNEIVYSCVLRACNSVQTVDNLLHEMKLRGVQKNSVVFTSAINVAHKYGDVGDATRWFDQMLEEGIKPDWVAYMSLFEVINSAVNSDTLLDTYYLKGFESGVLNHFAKDQLRNTLVLDLHGWSTALARAALRNTMKEYQTKFDNGFPIEGLKILTGKGYSKNTPVLRPAVTRMLQNEFIPSLDFTVDSTGEIEVSENTIRDYLSTKAAESRPQLRTMSVPKEDTYLKNFSFSTGTGVVPASPVDPTEFFPPVTTALDILEGTEQYIPPTHFPKRLALDNLERFPLRFSEEDDPLYEFHRELLGRDDSPPVVWVNPHFDFLKTKEIQL